MRDVDAGNDENAVEDSRPLISSSVVHETRPWRDNQDHVVLGQQLSFRSASPTVLFLTLSAGLSGFLFGFDTGVISATLVSIGSDLSNRLLTAVDKSIVTAVTSLLALLTAPATGFLADRYGRKFVIFVPAVLFVVGAVVQAMALHVWTMALGRALVGAAVGMASGAVPLYVTELAPAELRGRLVTVQSLIVTGGQAVAYLIGYLFAFYPHGWRRMVGFGAVPAIVQLLLLSRMPETPRWLVRMGRHERAREVLLQVYAMLPESDRAQMAESVLDNVQSEIAAEHKAHPQAEPGARNAFWDVARELATIPRNRCSLVIACMLQALQQLCGFNSLMYFSATIFSLVGFTSPIGTSLAIALTNLIFTMVAFTQIDTIGRRNILLFSIPFMILGLGACSVAFHFIDITPGSRPADAGNFWPATLLVSMIVYVAAYAVGLGCVPWQQSELFPLRVRSLGSGLATATNWSSNFVVGVTFLPMMTSIGASSTFALYAVICLVGWTCLWKVYPETAGLELEGIEELLDGGWCVPASVVAFKKRRRAALHRNKTHTHE